MLFVKFELSSFVVILLLSSMGSFGNSFSILKVLAGVIVDGLITGLDEFKLLEFNLGNSIE